MDNKYTPLEAVIQYLFLYLVLMLGLVRGDGLCRNASDYRRLIGSNATSTYCVSNISCLHFEEKIWISWNVHKEPETTDFYIGLSKKQTSGKHDYRILKGVENTKTSFEVKRNSTEPFLDLEGDYNVTINRRYTKEPSWRAFQISEECTKAKTTTSTIFRTSSMRTMTVSRKTISRTSGTSKNMSQKSTTVQKNMTRKPERQGNQNLIIGLCSAGGIAIVVVTIVIIICIKRRKENKQGTQNESKRQKGNESNRFEEEDTYNHLSHDHHVLNNERGRQRNYLTNDDGEEEDTYNHMSLRYHDDKGTTEAALQDTYSHITLAKEDSANRMQISTQSAGNYDDISFKDEGEKEQGDKGRGEGGQSGSNPDKSNTAVPVDVHEVINADVPSTSENETGTALNRTEGPKGDLYTEVAIKN